MRESMTLATSVIPGWFAKKRGTAYGIMSSGSSICGVIFPIMSQRLIPEVGFRWAMRKGAFVILFLLIIANLTIRSRLPPSPRPLSRSALTQPLREMKMLLVTAGFTLLTFGMYIPIDYLVVEGISNGIGTDLAQYLPAIMNAGRYVCIKFPIALKMYSLTYCSSIASLVVLALAYLLISLVLIMSSRSFAAWLGYWFLPFGSLPRALQVPLYLPFFLDIPLVHMFR